MNEGNTRQQIVEAIKGNSNILVTVSDSPSVDELSAALGLTILLNKIDKRATAIFSGAMPAAIKFLDPEKTLEGTVDSLRDFIIALDKEKADHLRYKVDGDVVKIFITPYRTTLTEKDLQFSQGDYNVELVIALGVKDQDHLDKALSAHGRILHDATVTTISVGAQPSTLGSIDWRDAAASSLCEMLVGLSEALKEEQPILDEQIATAFLTGIVSATDRFSNDHTSSRVMTMAAQLMAAGANQQLIAAKLQEANDIGPGAAIKGETNKNTAPVSEDKSSKGKKSDKKPKKDDDSLKIDRDTKKDKSESKPDVGDATQPAAAAVAIDEALQAAEPAKDVEEELSKQIDQVTADAPTAPPIEDIQKELSDAANEQSTSVSANNVSADVAPLAAPDNDMPGFESLDMPPSPVAPPAPAAPSLPPLDETISPAPAASDFIESRPGSSYLSDASPASFDAPVEGIIGGSNAPVEETPVDPFSVPLAPLPDLHESKDIIPDNIDPSALAPAVPPQDTPANVAADQDLPAFEELAPPVPTIPPQAADVSSLPPLPDLPPPPPPPVFDQLGGPTPPPAPSGAISADKLGDIFGDSGASPAADTPPSPPSVPPSPGQFRIPGQ